MIGKILVEKKFKCIGFSCVCEENERTLIIDHSLPRDTLYIMHSTGFVQHPRCISCVQWLIGAEQFSRASGAFQTSEGARTKVSKSWTNQMRGKTEIAVETRDDWIISTLLFELSYNPFALTSLLVQMSTRRAFARRRTLSSSTRTQMSVNFTFLDLTYVPDEGTRDGIWIETSVVGDDYRHLVVIFICALVDSRG